MIIYLYEYNVTPDVDKKDELGIKVEGNTVAYNNVDNSSDYVLGEIKKILISYKDALLNAKDIKCSNYKGGRQKQLVIDCQEICDERITLIGSTDNEEVAKLYDEIKNRLITLLES